MNTAASKKNAEIFINYMLRADISARYVNESGYATANEAALPLVDPAILNEPAVFPPVDQLKDVMRSAQIILPLSPKGEALYEEIWQRFLAAP